MAGGIWKTGPVKEFIAFRRASLDSISEWSLRTQTYSLPAAC
jgi:hypothetical protein